MQCTLSITKKIITHSCIGYINISNSTSYAFKYTCQTQKERMLGMGDKLVMALIPKCWCPLISMNNHNAI